MFDLPQPVIAEGRWAVLNKGKVVGPLYALAPSQRPWAWIAIVDGVPVRWTREGRWSTRGTRSALDIRQTFVSERKAKRSVAHG